MNFFKKIKDSIYNPAYYQELIEKPFSYSIRYYLVFGLLFSLLTTGKFLLFNSWKVYAEIGKIGPGIVAVYPDGLIINVKNGELRTNVEEPYEIKIPSSWEKENRNQKLPKNLIVIDTKSEASAENLNKLDTLILISKNYVIFQKENGQFTLQSLKEFPDFEINKDKVAEFVKKYAPYLKFLIPILLFFVFVGSYLAVLFHLIYLLLAALFIWVIASLKNTGLGYQKSYQLGLHLMTLPLIYLALSTFSIPFLFSAILLVLAAVNIKKNLAEPVPDNPPAA